MSSHPGKSYPTFKLDISEQSIYSNESREKLFGYVIESPKGPVNEPTFISSNQKAIDIFGVDFAPHFQQNGNGIIVVRVGLPNPEPAVIDYCIETSTEEEEVVTKTYKEAFIISSLTGGKSDIITRVIESVESEGGYTLNIEIPGVIEKNITNLPKFRSIVNAINSDPDLVSYVKAEMKIDDQDDKLDENQKLVVLKEGETFSETGPETKFNSLDNDTGKLRNGVFGKYFNPDKTIAEIEAARKPDGTYDTSVIGDEITTYQLYTGSDDDFDGNMIKPKITKTASVLYKQAFALTKDIDLLGVTTFSELDVVQKELKDHILECIDSETNILRFGITAFLDYNNPKKTDFQLSDIEDPAIALNSEYIIYLGQGVKFKTDDGVTYDIPPHKAMMLYTGIRSVLTYDEAIYGGDDKKILDGVIDVLPIIPGRVLTKKEREELNENGVTTFKREYDRVTFLEGDTTSQESDVLSYENIMSIVIHVTKRLVTITKRYQGKKMTEDLKESLRIALLEELRSLHQNDGCLVAIKDETYDIPAYDVEVESAAMAVINEMGELVRQSKVVVKVKIVPVGALRDIDLGVIVI